MGILAASYIGFVNELKQRISDLTLKIVTEIQEMKSMVGVGGSKRYEAEFVYESLIFITVQLI